MSIPAGLRALRLNRHFPDWRPLASHVEVSGASRCRRTGWPLPAELMQVRADRELAPSLLRRMAFLNDQGLALAKRARLQALLDRPLVGRGGLKVELVHQEQRRYELVLDRLELALPVFVRWTLRLRDPDGRVQQRLDLERLLVRLSHQPVAAAMRWLREAEGLDVSELVRGEIGPIRPGPNGPQVTASLSRADVTLRRVLVDDPLRGDMPVPEQDDGFGLSHQRKWAVHPDDLGRLKAWLKARGSRNIAYAWRKPSPPTRG